MENSISFEKLYNEYKDLVYNLCRRYCVDCSEAEDVCHDVFLKIHKNIESFREESKISTWIYRLTINHCLNHIRRKKILSWLSIDFLSREEKSHFDIPDHTADLESDYDKKENEALLNCALEKLPERQRTALLLNRYEDLSYQEIAEIMQCSVSSVESLIFRAKQSLTKQLLKRKP